MSLAYYNEIDPKAAAWLRELMAAGVIAPGLVDERSILDVKPGDLDGFTQCHFFAGIGVWSYALRLAGWSDDRPVWSGSCPCQPFSQAGRGDGFADERHLWPYWHYLIAARRPPVVFGEQVASKDGLAWLDLVLTDLEGTGYASEAADLCAAGVGAPHIRQRLWIVAKDVLGNADGERAGERRGPLHRAQTGEGRGRCGDAAAAAGAVDLLGHAERPGREGGLEDDLPGAGWGREGRLAVESGGEPAGGPTNGHWAECEWVFCRDGKYRPLEPCFVEMVDGAACNLGPVRPDVAAAFVQEVMQSVSSDQTLAGEALRALQDSVEQEALRERPPRRPNGVSEARILLAFLRQLAQQGRAQSFRISSAGQEVDACVLRVLRDRNEPARSPRERGLGRQPEGQLTDTVRVLSSVLARHASAAWAETLDANAAATAALSHEARARIARLRGYGNAIVAQVAQAWIEACEEAGLTR